MKRPHNEKNRNKGLLSLKKREEYDLNHCKKAVGSKDARVIRRVDAECELELEGLHTLQYLLLGMAAEMPAKFLPRIDMLLEESAKLEKYVLKVRAEIADDIRKRVSDVRRRCGCGR